MSQWKTVFAIGATMAGGLALASAKGAPGRSLTETAADVKRGEYLVTTGHCNDCHTPLVMGKQGPEPDMSRRLSGHPEQLAMPAPPSLPEGPWQVVASGTLTAWSGPWGVSFASNITPDKETGIGSWTEQQFIDTIRTGRHEGGRGRPILPPMPWQNVAALTDADLKAVFAYLRSIDPIKNRVPEARPPPAQAATPPASQPPTGSGTGTR